MILTCPACEARFQVRLEALGSSGRKVRCGDCGHTWHQNPSLKPDQEAAAGSGDSLRQEAPVRKTPRDQLEAIRRTRKTQQAAAPKQKSNVISAGWATLAVLAGGVLVGGLIGRDQIREHFPATAGIYDLLNLGEAVPGEGLALEDVNSSRDTVDGTRVLTLTGQVANISEYTRPVPLLQARITNGTGQELISWSFSADESTLQPGARTQFETTAENPPAGGTQLSIGFVQQAANQ